ncbi:MAG: hypothetical protein J7L22_11920 [Candidatus Marinimicrobia bacterium]|nr:hypothetical protein [Candidatus Neomarinimicrobiota bacterium]
MQILLSYGFDQIEWGLFPCRGKIFADLFKIEKRAIDVVLSVLTSGVIYK